MAASECWVCRSAKSREWKARNLPGRLSPEDLKITDAHYGRTLRLLRCEACGFIFADAAELTELQELYGWLEDDGYTESSQGRTLQMRRLLERVLRQTGPIGSLLDVGCAAGLALEQARDLGIEAVGVEPSAAMVSIARSRGLDALRGVLPHPGLEGRTFDVVALFDVIEHVADPVGLLKASARYLQPGGRLVVVTPDIGSVAARTLGKRWWHLRVAHVCYFDDRTLTRAVEAAGLKVSGRFRPNWYFPVSYLMERLRRYVPLPLPTLKGAWLGERVIPLQLGDSWAFLLQKA